MRGIRVSAVLVLLCALAAAAGQLDQDESAAAEVLTLVAKPAPALEASVWFGPTGLRTGKV